MSRLPDEASFLRDVAHHKMAVLRDDGLYRHVRFRVGTSWHMSFDVTTWPGYLTFTGDMGSFIFARIPDMFEFFRSPVPGSANLSINPGYWGEKIQAVDRNSGIEEYSPERFRKLIAEWLDDAEASSELRAAVDDEVLAYVDDGERDAVGAAIEFEFKGRRPFADFWEVDVKDYTYRFMWCCYALAWAVRMYDGRTADAATPVANLGATA